MVAAHPSSALLPCRVHLGPVHCAGKHGVRVCISDPGRVDGVHQQRVEPQPRYPNVVRGDHAGIAARRTQRQNVRPDDQDPGLREAPQPVPRWQSRRRPHGTHGDLRHRHPGHHPALRRHHRYAAVAARDATARQVGQSRSAHLRVLHPRSQPNRRSYKDGRRCGPAYGHRPWRFTRRAVPAAHPASAGHERGLPRAWSRRGVRSAVRVDGGTR